jgi:hypothetical protein
MEKFYRVCKKYENKMEKIANKELKKWLNEWTNNK